MHTKNNFIKNLIAAFAAQGISLLMSVLMSLVVPKFLNLTEYGYWQLFIFYVGYVGFFHFGYNDGIYLRLGGSDYENLNHKKLGTESRLFAGFECIIAALIAVFVAFAVDSPERKIILIIAALYMVFNNLTLFFGYIFQAVNETKIFSFSTILDRIFVLISIIVLLIFRVDSYLPFIICYTISKCLSLAYCVIRGHKIAFSGGYKLIPAIKDMWISTKIGIKLTIANIASMLILGMGRLVIDNIWGIETFGKISFSLTMTNFFLLFIQQVAMVMFPALRRVDSTRQEQLYLNIRTGLGIFLPIVLVAYVPIKMILSMWLPQYSESLNYLALLLPICIFDGKTQMLYNTYFKVLREEKILLYVNVISLIVSAVCVAISGFVLNSLTAVVISMLFAIAFRSVIAEILLSRKMKLKVGHMLISEILVVAICTASAWIFDNLAAFIIDILAYAVFVVINKSEIISLYKLIKK